MAEQALMLVHLIAAVAMAAGLYMLIVVGERARFDRPLNYSTDPDLAATRIASPSSICAS